LSREYRGRKVVVYPSYLDSSLTRKQGRRIPASLSVPSPSIEEIFQAALKLGLNPVLEKDKAYPGQWWVKGRVLVDKNAEKHNLLIRIAKEIKENRSRKPLK